MQEKGDAEFQKRLGIRIRRMRSDRGFSQESFADECGIHRTYMGSIERGERNLTIGSLRTIAKALKVTVAQILKGLE
jgi:transcriptional regulator with XRE-family HTH domain